MEREGPKEKTNSLSFSSSCAPLPPKTTSKTSRSLYNGDDDSEEDDDEDDDPYASSRCQRRRCRDHNAAGACGPSASSAGARSYPLAPALIPTRSVYGHLDWVFGLDWITERHLVTGSRDRTLALWVRFFFFAFFFIF